MRTDHKAVAPLIAALVIMLVTGFATVPRHAHGADHGIDRLPGSWRAEITPDGPPGQPPPPSLPALITFTSDGALIATESPGPFESPGLGNWERRGRDVAFTFLVLFGGPAGGGQNTGSAKVVGLLRFDARHGTWSGPFRLELLDTDDGVLATVRGMLRLKRIEVESF
jgi:hypothetical protein